MRKTLGTIHISKLNIYYIPNSKQVKEKQFFDHLINGLPKTFHKKERFNLSEELLYKTLNINEIIKTLHTAKGISELKRNVWITELEKLPENVLILNSIKDISVDFVIELHDNTYFIEFHENQHRVDSNKRMKFIYDINNNPLSVPRYLQRLLRDIWRWKYLKNYKIVWFDWFSRNSDFSVGDLLTENNFEYSLENKFRISDF